MGHKKREREDSTSQVDTSDSEKDSSSDSDSEAESSRKHSKKSKKSKSRGSADVGKRPRKKKRRQKSSSSSSSSSSDSENNSSPERKTKKKDSKKKSKAHEKSESSDSESSASSDSSNTSEESSNEKQRKKLEKKNDKSIEIDKKATRKEKVDESGGKDVRHDRNDEKSKWDSPEVKDKRMSPTAKDDRISQQESRKRIHKDGYDNKDVREKWDKGGKNPDRDRRYRDSNRNDMRRDDVRFDNRRKNDRNISPRRDYPSRKRDSGERYSRNRESNGKDENRRKPRHDTNEGHRSRGHGGTFNSNRSAHFEEGPRDRRRGEEGNRDRYPKGRMKEEPSPEWGRPTVKDESKAKPQEKEKPNFELSGKLTEDANTVNGVVIKYSEPSDARKPKRRWRLYPFKGEKALPTLYVHRQSAYLMGRDRKIADIPLDHPSCSKQHAALQYRLVSFQREDGGEGRRIRPYLIDLESANGTFVNNVKLEARRYHELLERDVLRFGFSSREYVLLHEHSRDDALDDDVPFTNTAQVSPSQK